MHDLSIRVPLIVYDPRRNSTNIGSVASEYVLNVDVAPTILDLAGLSTPQIYQGKSFSPLLHGSQVSWRDEILTEHLWDHPDIPQTEAVRTKNWKYIRYPQHPEFEELYDLKKDHYEENNLAFDRRFSETKAKLSKRCDFLIQKASRI
jgi:arylsulfatase A-like enzyme